MLVMVTYRRGNTCASDSSLGRLFFKFIKLLISNKSYVSMCPQILRYRRINYGAEEIVQWVCMVLAFHAASPASFLGIPSSP